MMMMMMMMMMMVMMMTTTTMMMLYCNNNNLNVKYRAIFCPVLSRLPTVPDYQGPDYQHLAFLFQKAHIYLTVNAAYTSGHPHNKNQQDALFTFNLFNN